MQDRLLAKTVVNQLVQSGYDLGALLSFAGEILRAVNEHPGNPVEADEGDHSLNDREPLPFRLELSDCLGSLRVVGHRVYLRPVVAQDCPHLRRWHEEPAIRGTFSMRTLAEVIRQLDSNERDPARCDLVVCLKDDRPIGLVGLRHIDPDVRQAETTKLLGDLEARGHGYAHEATLLMLAYAFGTLKLRRAYLRTAGYNMPNIRLNERAGFRYEGVLHAADRIAERVVDVVLMGILADDFGRRYDIIDVET